MKERNNYNTITDVNRPGMIIGKFVVDQIDTHLIEMNDLKVIFINRIKLLTFKSCSERESGCLSNC